MHNYVTNLCIVLYCNWGVDHPLGLSVFCLPSINNNNNNASAIVDVWSAKAAKIPIKINSKIFNHRCCEIDC